MSACKKSFPAILASLGLIVSLAALSGCGGNGESASTSNQPTTAAEVRTAERIATVESPGEFVVQSLALPVGGASQYLVYLPKGFRTSGPGMSDMRGRLWPMVVYLHCSSPDGSPKTMEQLRGDGINYYIEHGGQDFPAIVVSPLEASYFHDEAFVDAVIRDAQAKYPVDRSRVSLAGFSLGGLGAYPVALAFPHRFSAVLAAGGGFTDDLFFGPQAITEYGNGLRHLQNTPFHVVHGDADMNVPVAVADNAVKALRNAEVTVTYDRMPGVDHLGSTNYAFNAESLGALIKQRGERLDDETNHIHHADRLVGRYEFASTSGSPQVLHLSVDTQGRLIVENETFATTTAYYPIGDDRYVSNSMFYRMVRNADGRMSCMYWIGTFWGAPIYTDAEHAATCGYGPQN